MNKMYYRGVQGVVLVCDLCDSDTFHNLETWLRDYLEHTDQDNIQDVAFILLANKVDNFRLRQQAEGGQSRGTNGSDSGLNRHQIDCCSEPITEENL